MLMSMQPQSKKRNPLRSQCSSKTAYCASARQTSSGSKYISEVVIGVADFRIIELMGIVTKLAFVVALDALDGVFKKIFLGASACRMTINRSFGIRSRAQRWKIFPSRVSDFECHSFPSQIRKSFPAPPSD